MTALELELFEALLKVRSAFYVEGTRKALKAAFSETHDLVNRVKKERDI